jgi:hypothetical protein
MRRLATVAVFFLGAAACGGGGDAPPDAPPSADASLDPFAGIFDDPSDFPHTNCTPGSLAGFDYVGIYTDVGLRTVLVDGTLATYLVESQLTDVLREHILTADDLFVRGIAVFGETAIMRAIDACAADADGTLRGRVAYCSEGNPCDSYEFEARPLHRIAGESEGMHLSLVGELGWPPGTVSTNVRVDGDFAFLSRLRDGVRIVSIANPAAPVEVGHFVAAEDYVNDLKVVHPSSGGRFVVTASSVSRVINVTTASEPMLAAEIPTTAHTVFVEGDLAYFAGYGGRIPVYSLANPSAPVELGAWDSPDGCYHDLYIEDSIGYLSECNGLGLDVVDFTNPAKPVRLGLEGDDGTRYWHSPWRTTVDGRSLVVHGDEGAGTVLRVLDGDPASAEFLATLSEWSSRPEVSIHNIMAVGSTIYATHYQDGVRVLDISQPSDPRVVGYFNTWSEYAATAAFFQGAIGLDLDVARRRIYVADTLRGLVILSGDDTVFP